MYGSDANNVAVASARMAAIAVLPLTADPTRLCFTFNAPPCAVWYGPRHRGGETDARSISFWFVQQKKEKNWAHTVWSAVPRALISRLLGCLSQRDAQTIEPSTAWTVQWFLEIGLETCERAFLAFFDICRLFRRHRILVSRFRCKDAGDVQRVSLAWYRVVPFTTWRIFGLTSILWYPAYAENVWTFTLVNVYVNFLVRCEPTIQLCITENPLKFYSSTWPVERM